jgi:hypothetical protein
LLLTDILPFVMMRRVAAVLCLAALAGCGSETEPQPLPPVASGSPSPAAALPVPPEATPETAAGAAAFARYYLDVLGLAFETADPTQLRSLSASGCGGCDALITSVAELQEQGRKRVGGRYLIKDVAAPPVEAGDVIVEVVYEREAAQVLDAQGQIVASAPSVPMTNAQLRLLRRGEAWVVQGYRVVES